MGGHQIGYIRASSLYQNTERQLRGVDLDKNMSDKKTDIPVISKEPKRRVSNRELFARELLAAMVLTVLLMALSVFLPVFCQGDSSEHTVIAPWLFIWVQELLRYFPPLSGGVIIPLSLLGIMAALPWLPGKSSPQSGRRYCFGLHQAFILLTGLVLTLLTCLGL